MEIPDAEATFLAEALGDLPDREKAIGFFNTFIHCSSALVREGALLGLARILSEEKSISRRHYDAAKDLICIVKIYDTDEYLRKMAARILGSGE